MNKFRLKNKYAILSGVLLIISMYVFLILDYPQIIDVFIFKKTPVEFPDLKEYIYTLFHFDHFVNTSVAPLQLILPIIAMIPTLHFREELHHYFHHSLTRNNKYNKQILTSLFINACIIGLYIYISYVICLIFSSFIFPINNDRPGIHDLLINIVGRQFFFNHRLIYYFMTGLFEIFLPCFVNSLMTMTLLFVYEKTYMPFVITYVYYVFMSIFIPIIAEALQCTTLHYFSPAIMMYTNALSEPSFIFMLLGYIQYIVIIVLLLLMIFKDKERIY